MSYLRHIIRDTRRRPMLQRRLLAAPAMPPPAPAQPAAIPQAMVSSPAIAPNLQAPNPAQRPITNHARAIHPDPAPTAAELPIDDSAELLPGEPIAAQTTTVKRSPPAAMPAQIHAAAVSHHPGPTTEFPAPTRPASPLSPPNETTTGSHPAAGPAEPDPPPAITDDELPLSPEQRFHEVELAAPDDLPEPLKRALRGEVPQTPAPADPPLAVRSGNDPALPAALAAPMVIDGGQTAPMTPEVRINHVDVVVREPATTAPRQVRPARRTSSASRQHLRRL